MGTKSKGKSGSRNGAVAKVKTTPSGITYDEFMKMSVEQREQAITDILSNDNITVPDYLDQTATQKVIYALGMDGKPQVLNDTQLDKLSGQDLYRTVNGNKYLTAGEITDQIKLGDYTRLSDSGGSVYGRGIYFANDLVDSLGYGWKNDTAVIRIKPTKDAKLVTYSELYKQMPSDGSFGKIFNTKGKIKPNSDDEPALFALSRGLDGWYHPGAGYYVFINRSKIAVSKTTKHGTHNWASDTTWNKLIDY